MLVIREDKRVRLLSHNGTDWTKRYPWIAEAALKRLARTAREWHLCLALEGRGRQLRRTPTGRKARGNCSQTSKRYPRLRPAEWKAKKTKTPNSVAQIKKCSAIMPAPPLANLGKHETANHLARGPLTMRRKPAIGDGL
ncbi:hypothetical protein SO180_36150 [Bradyrhizobium sp. UFLA05-112]